MATIRTCDVLGGIVTVIFGFVVFVTSFAKAEFVLQEINPRAITAAEAVWNSTEVDNAKITYIQSSTEGPHRLPLTLVIDKNSPWTVPLVMDFVRAAEDIFRQCHLAISPITVVELHHPQLGDFTPSTDYLITKDFPPQNHRPLIVFNNGSYGSVYANAEYYKDHEFETLTRQTAFIDYLALGFHSAVISRNYFIKTVVAHELLHLLLNAPHNTIPGNILSTFKKGEEINSDQCSVLLKNDLVKSF
jgi:hypothetical protein